jgi:thiol-disulfide isomerase/thioredoxin
MFNSKASHRVSSLLALSASLAGCSSGPKGAGEHETSAGPNAVSVRLPPVTGYAARHIGSWAPWTTEISANIPASLHKVPEHSSEAVFGEFSFGEGTRYKVTGKKVGFMLDEARERFIADENRNGDLTDDLPASWTVERRPSRDGTATIGQVTVRTEIAAHERYNAPSFSVALFFRDAVTRAKYGEPLSLDRYRDYATEGILEVGAHSYRILLDDGAVTGDFAASLASPRSDISLRIDVNGNGAFESKGEEFDADKPFTLHGVTYQVLSISPDGTRLELVRSSVAVPEIPPPPDLRVGARVPSFTATTLTGEKITFPDSFKGKIVLLDFWASWCGPCVAELPHLRSAFEQFRGDGFEIVSVAIDEEKSRAKAHELIQAQKMEWFQIFDSGGWTGEIISRFSPEGVPAGYLVDGDTGLIVASLQQLRGNQLGPKIRQILQAKREGELQK